MSEKTPSPYKMPGSNNSQLVGKVSTVTDSYVNVQRDPNNIGSLAPGTAVEYLNCVYLPDSLRNQYSNQSLWEQTDMLRTGAGKHWDYQNCGPTLIPVNSDAEAHERYWVTNGGTPKFQYNWVPISTFFKQPLELDFCDEGLWIENSDGGTYYQKLLIKNTNPVKLDTVNSEDISEFFNLQPEEVYQRWIYMMKTGVTNDAGTPLKPMIRANYVYYDHTYESQSPFTPQDLVSKQPIGKAFYANYKTYYNERTRNFTYENFIGNKPKIQNSLPNIYGFIHLVGNKRLSDHNFLNLSKIIGPDDHDSSGVYINKYIPVKQGARPSNYFESGPDGGGEVYTELLNTYPLETALTLYGKIGLYGSWPKVIEQIVTLNYEKTDATTLFNQYLQQWLAVYQEDPAFTAFDTYWQSDIRQGYPRSFVGSLENTAYNIIFSPEFIPIMNKADKYKNYFPMYVELEFTADTQTNFGDFIRQVFMTKFFANMVASKEKPNPLMGFNMGDASITAPRGTAAAPWSEWDEYQNHTAAHLGEAGVQYKPLELHASVQETGREWTMITPYEIEQEVEMSVWDPMRRTSSPCSKLYSWSAPDANGNRRKCVRNMKTLKKRWRGGYRLVKKSVSTQEGGYKTLSLNTSETKDLPPEAIVAGSFDLVQLLKNWMAGDTYNQRHSQPSIQDQRMLDSVNSWMMWLDVRHFTTFVGTGGDEEKINLETDENSLFRNLVGPSFLARLRETYRLKRRSYEDIINGVPAYTEDLFYRIEKMRKLPDQDWEIVQNIIIPNTSELDVVKYVDTQVKYGAHANYKYKVYVEKLVFGSAYHYRWPSPGSGPHSGGYLAPGLIALFDGSFPAGEHLNQGITDGEFFSATSITIDDHGEDNSVEVDFTASPLVFVNPSIRLIETKLFETGEISILDRPPVAPHVDVLPFRAVNNRIQIIISGMTDRYRAEPIQLLTSDADSFGKLMAAQGSTDGKIEFGSDDPISSFQVFRTRIRPDSYSDFSFHPTRPNIVGGSGAFEDNILPNTKYYYTFRAVDSHGHISNPTPVYEVELIDEKGAVKPLIRTISMDPPESIVNSKECKKYIYIKPTLKQLFFANQPEVDPIFSSETEDKRKRYKMRLISKGSGKKIDINFSFHPDDTLASQPHTAVDVEAALSEANIENLAALAKLFST